MSGIGFLVGESVSLLRQVVSIPSPSFGEERVSDFVSERLSSYGIGFVRLKNNILAVSRNYDPQRPTLMLCAHLDTVSPSDDYSFDPYSPDYTELDSRRDWLGRIGVSSAGELVAGLGANDDGASAVALLSAFRYFRESVLPFNLLLILGAEEERSGADGMQLVWSELEKGVSVDGVTVGLPCWAIVGEPTGLQAAVGERGLLVIDGTAQGKSGHAARNEGVNALYIAIEDISRLRNFRFDKVSELMGEVKLSVTQINAGTAHNVVPDRCSFVVDIRPTEQYDNPEIMGMLEAVCRSELKARNLTNRSSATSRGSVLKKCAQVLGLGTFVSPTTSDWMRIGCDAVKLGPGQSSRSHGPDEYVTVSELEQGIRTYIDFISALAGLAE